MIEFLLQIIGEFILQIVVEALFALGYGSLAETLKRPPNFWLSALGFLLFGAIAGGLSLLAFPSNLTPAGMPRIVNLIFTPLFVGLWMSLIGAWRSKRGKLVLRIDKFWYGYCFALALALVRFRFAR